METTLQETVKTAWQKSKWIVKGCIIGFLALLMMIPMLYVKNLIFEREERQKEAAREISSKWAGKQNIIGPVIGIPFWQTQEGDTGTARKSVRKNIAYFLPDKLNITAMVNPKEKHRGIFKVMLYDTKATLSGSFTKPAFDKLGISAEQVIWNEAFVIMNIADNKGLNDQLTLNWKDSLIELSPEAGSSSDRMTAPLAASSAEDIANVNFTTTIDLNGSEQLFFTPVGKLTTVNMESAWKHPSFSGSMLPQTSDVSDSGFKASWKSMSHKRSFPQQWIGNAYRLDHYFPLPVEEKPVRFDGSIRAADAPPVTAASVGASAFGVDLFIPVNGYQKTLRTIKYALLCILLTFAAFFLIETAHKKSVHPFQYGLVGLALILFYTLLLSFSEYTGFNTAYMIASAATIGLIAWFVKGVLQSGRATSVLSVVLVLIYAYVFSLLQLQDYSLLLGSIGLFLTLAVVMYFSKKLQW
ncbi:MAG: cell envelope integrity protein CreD [Chitinophagaceae bacterium]|nr:cell envelope integrity protein CreD [Chitinophagaceae bacterium]